MDLFLSDEEFAKLEALVASAAAQTPKAGLDNRVALAWHLRERDSRRAD